MYMHHYGGVYADLDMELLRPLQPLLAHTVACTGARVLLGEEPRAHALLLESVERQTCNAFIASEAGHPFFLWLLKLIVWKVTTEAALDMEDPVGTTGPRFLESALVEWERAHGANSSARVYVLHPDTLYPLWDGGQRETFQQRCEASDTGSPAQRPVPTWANSSDITMRGLGEQVVSLCARLAAEAFKPTIYPASFTAHRWSHTWLNGVRDEQRTDDEQRAALVDTLGVADAPAPAPIDAPTLQALAALDAELALPPTPPTPLVERATSAPSWWRGLLGWLL